MDLILPLSRKISAITVAALLAASCALAHAEDLPVEADQMVRSFHHQSGSPGLAVSVGRQGRIIWSQGYGLADVEQQVPVRADQTLFRVGSVAKPMTGLALAQLAASGRIDLDADARRYVPSFPPKEQDFSVRQLAGHLAGIRHYVGEEAYRRTHYSGVMDSMVIFEKDPLAVAPGSQWKYSTYGYTLLSAVIESAAGQPFLDHMAEAVFAPLGMAATVPDRLDRLLPHRGRYYVRRDGIFYNEPEVDNSYKWAGGGLLSTTDDLVRFGLAHLDEGIVPPAVRDLMWTEQRTDTGEATGYGLGWRIVVDAEGTRWIGHGGGSIGGTTQLWLSPDSGLAISMASNLTDLDYADILPRLRKLFMSRNPGGIQR